jgi:hypothetical protein
VSNKTFIIRLTNTSVQAEVPKSRFQAARSKAKMNHINKLYDNTEQVRSQEFAADGANLSPGGQASVNGEAAIKNFFLRDLLTPNVDVKFLTTFFLLLSPICQSVTTPSFLDTGLIQSQVDTQC